MKRSNLYDQKWRGGLVLYQSRFAIGCSLKKKCESKIRLPFVIKKVYGVEGDAWAYLQILGKMIYATTY